MRGASVRRWFGLSAAVGLMAGGSAWGQAQPQAPGSAQNPAPSAMPQPGDELPSAESLFARHAEAVGGLEKAFQHDSRLVKGISRGSRSSSFLTLYYENPNRLAFTAESPGSPKVTSVFDGTYGWRLEEGVDEPTLLRGAELVEMAESADFAGEVNYLKRYRGVRTRGVEQTEDGRTLYRVAAESVNGRRSLLFFDAESGRIARAIVPQLIGDQVVQMQTDLSNYQPIDGFYIPHTLRQELLGVGWSSEITIRSIEPNVDRSELLERSPAVQAALDKAIAELDAETNANEAAKDRAPDAGG